MLQSVHNDNLTDSVRAAAMPFAVTQLNLTDFRNYDATRLDVGPATVVLTGANGSGKTNILEALSYLTAGRGLRGVRLGEVSRLGGAGGWAVAARIMTPLGDRRIGTGIEGRAQQDEAGDVDNGGTDRRIVRIDGEDASGPAALGEIINVSWLTPQMDGLFTDGRSERRRFLDRLVQGLDTDHTRRVGAYERAMRERLRLLRDRTGDDAWLAALEARMAEDGVAIAAARRLTIDRLRSAAMAGIGPFPKADLAVTGMAETALDEAAAVDVEARLQDVLRGNRARDADRGQTHEGAHRADLEVVHVEKEMPAVLCSTGEQKALLVSIVLADARLQAAQRGAPPILLLDEITAHLDDTRRVALFGEIAHLGAQAWLTGTDRGLFDGLSGTAWFGVVEDGKVTFSDG